MPTSAVGMADSQNLHLRCQMLEIEKSCAVWRCEEYQNLLEQFNGGIGPTRESEERGQPIASSSRSVPTTPSGPSSTPRQQRPLPSLVERRNDQGRRLRQRPHRFRTNDTGPRELVQRGNQANERVFVGIIAKLCTDNSLRNRTAIFSAAGLGDYKLAPREAASARQTPNIPWQTFTWVFGGWLYSERPKCKKVPEYGNFICTSNSTQPFAPTRIGEPGVIFSSPGAALLDTFHVLVDLGEKKTELRYCGIYTKVHISSQVQVDEWHAMPTKCRRRWLDKIGRRPVGDVHARSTLRKRQRLVSYDPSLAEIRNWIRKYGQGVEVMERNAVQDAFDSGTEKLSFEMIFCVGYDTGLAERLKRETEREIINLVT